MALPWGLALLSLLPLLYAQSTERAQSLECTNYTVPITNATLDQVGKGKWFYIASAVSDPLYREMESKIATDFFYLTPGNTEGTLLLREYITMRGDPSKGDYCVYNASTMTFSRENGTLHKTENGTEFLGLLMFPEDRGTFMINYGPVNQGFVGLSFYADKPEVTPEQMAQFYKDLACKGLDKVEVTRTDMKKDMCEPLEVQHEKERKKENERAEKDTALN